MYFMASPKAPAKSIRAAPLTACPMRLNILLPLAGVRVDPVRVALGFEFQGLAPRLAGGLRVAEGVQSGHAAVTGRRPGAGREQKRSERQDRANAPSGPSGHLPRLAVEDLRRRD